MVSIAMINYQLFEAGYCLHCERMTRKQGAFKQQEYPALCALIKHPQQGYILFDTGYTNRFMRLTQKFPFSLYRHLTPVRLQKSLKDQLLEKGINPDEIKHVVISHFHADHIGGLADFPNARFICHADALEAIKDKKGFKALLLGFLPGLLPVDFYDRVHLLTGEGVELSTNLNPFVRGYDLFNDELIYAIELPGHAKGQIGLYFNSLQPTFLVADSCWHSEAYTKQHYPSELTYLLHANRRDYLATINKLQQLHSQQPNIDIIPSHCQHVRARLSENKTC